MREIKCPYLRYLVTPLHIKPAQYVYRPVIPVKLFLGKQSVIFDALIDSGADDCIFPGWLAKTLGHDIYKGKKKNFSGIGGSVLAYLCKTHLKLEDIEFVIGIYYSHEWDNMPFGLLGQTGFFSHFDIHFNYNEKIVALQY